MSRPGSYLSQMCGPLLCDGAGDIIGGIIKGSTGGKKLEFPYVLPPLQIEFTPQGKRDALFVVGTLALGIAANGAFNYFSKTK